MEHDEEKHKTIKLTSMQYNNSRCLYDPVKALGLVSERK